MTGTSGTIDVFTLIALIVAVIAILKLRSVLGRRSDDDDARLEKKSREVEMQRKAGAAGQQNLSDKVVTLPRREREDAPAASVATASAGEVEARLRTFANGDESIARGLMEITRTDPAFDPEHFVRGARQAYEMIVTAFAEGNRKMLKDLLSKDVYEGFVASIAEREARGEQIDQSFVGINKADIYEAEVKGGLANVTVRFVSQLITATRDKAGIVVSGDPSRVKDVTDIWTFSRDISTVRARQNPNWKLIATQAPN